MEETLKDSGDRIVSDTTVNDKDKSGERRLYFDVINSVKGGSGKSTVSLLLAACLKEQGVSAYVIDLDLCGSSWYSNFKKTISGASLGNLSWINDWMLDSASSRKKKPFADITIQVHSATNPSNPKVLNIQAAIVNTDEPFVVDEVETDLFENAVFQIIDTIVATEAAKNEKTAIHIILDMPPSYDPHAERVLNHLLLNADSQLMHKFDSPKGPYTSFRPYYVNLIMLSSVSEAHLNLNQKYIDRFAGSKKFSSRIDQLIADKRFHLLFWGNDVTSVTSSSISMGGATANLKDAFLRKLTQAQIDSAEALTTDSSMVTNIILIDPILLDHADQIYHDIISITALPSFSPAIIVPGSVNATLKSFYSIVLS